MNFPSIIEASGRRYWAFLVILGGCIVFTVFAAVGVYLVSDNAMLSFYLALAAHAQLFVGMGTFGFVLGRQLKFKGSRDGLEYEDSGSPIEGARQAQEAVEQVVENLEDKG